MRKIQITIMLVVFLFSSFQCTKSPNEPHSVRELTSIEKTIVDSDNRFGIKLFQEIVKTQKDTNVFISPLSVSMALGNDIEWRQWNDTRGDDPYAGIGRLIRSAD